MSGGTPSDGTSLSDDGRYVRVRRRSRRSSRRRSRERARRLLRRAAAVGAVALVVAVPSGVVANDLVVARRALIGAEAELRDARAALVAGDLTRAAGAVRSADLLVTPLPGRLARPVWGVATRLPFVGADLRLARAVVGTAAAGTTLARVAVDEDLGVLADGLDPRVVDGRIDLLPLLDAAARLDRLDPEPLRAALSGLDGAGGGASSAALLDARRSLLDLGGEAVAALDRTRAVAAALPGLLGADGPRTHLIVLQTSAELRGTGGLLGQWTLARVDGGRIELDPVATTDVLTGSAPVRVPAAFLTRYAHVNADRVVSNANVDPDLATTAGVVLDLFASRTGTRPDGLVLLDPFGLQALLEALDVTLTLPAAAVEGVDLPATLPASRFARFVTVDVYDALGDDRFAERDALQAALAQQALAEVLIRPWDGPRVARAVLAAARGRHLQVHSTDRDERAALATVPAGGDLAGALGREDADVLAVTHNNFVGGKQDVHLGHRLAIGVQLVAPDAAAPRGPDGTVEVDRRLVAEVGISNTLEPGAHDVAITGNCLVGVPGRGCFDGPEAENRSWVTFWLDAVDTVLQVTDADGFPDVVTGAMHGAATYDVYVDVPPLESRSVRLEAEGPVPAVLDPDGLLTYRWSFWRQAKGVPDVVDVTLAAPDGWEVEGAALVGAGASVPLAGPDADREGATLRVRRRSVSLAGALGSDAEVVLRLRPVAG